MKYDCTPYPSVEYGNLANSYSGVSAFKEAFKKNKTLSQDTHTDRQYFYRWGKSRPLGGQSWSSSRTNLGISVGLSKTRVAWWIQG